MDLFFYREPEEAKEKEEEEALPPPDFGIADYGAAPLVASDQWSAQIPDAQWGAADVVVPAAAAAAAAAAIPPPSSVEWTSEPGWILAFTLNCLFEYLSALWGGYPHVN